MVSWDLYDPHDLHRVAGWEPHDLHYLAHVSYVRSIRRYRSRTCYLVLRPTAQPPLIAGGDSGNDVAVHIEAPDCVRVRV